ncbi:hypothetical protein [Paenibacillus marinisediminis]
MNNKKRNKWIITILAALTMVLVAGCSDNKSAETPKTPDKQVESKDNKQPSKEEHKDGHENEADLETFTSKEGGFSLVQPDKWKNNVSAVEGKDEQMAAIEWQTSFHLVVNGKADENAEALVTISKITRENYDEMSIEEGPPIGDKLAEDDKYVWVMTTPQSNPYEESSDENKKFDDMAVGLNDIKNNFKVTE